MYEPDVKVAIMNISNYNDTRPSYMALMNSSNSLLSYEYPYAISGTNMSNYDNTENVFCALVWSRTDRCAGIYAGVAY